MSKTGNMYLVFFMYQINVLGLSTFGLSDYLCKGFYLQDRGKINWTYVTFSLNCLLSVYLCCKYRRVKLFPK